MTALFRKWHYLQYYKKEKKRKFAFRYVVSYVSISALPLSRSVLVMTLLQVVRRRKFEFKAQQVTTEPRTAIEMNQG